MALFMNKNKMMNGDAMIRVRDHKQDYLFDPWDYLGPKRRKLMDESWAGLFREHILKELPVNCLASCFTAGFGRPTKELSTALGTLLLQQAFDMPDEEALSQLSFNTQWHYALNIPEESDDAKYMSAKTLWTMRRLVIENGLEDILFRQITDSLAELFSVDTSKQRLDSVHIRSNMKRLGRIGICVRGLHKFFVNLKRQQEKLFETLPKEIVDKYLPDKALSCFSMVKPPESERTLASVGKDLYDVTQRFQGHDKIKSMNSFRLLLRILEEQFIMTEGTEGAPVELSMKPSKAVSSNSLQNPSDPDATYSGHKGQGYQVQVMETYCTTDDQETKDRTLNLITHVAVETACESDVHALIPALESTAACGLAPEEVLADSLYGSDENREAAREMGVDVISPVMGSMKKEGVHLSNFSFDEKGNMTCCPGGQAPVATKIKKGRHIAVFSHDHCGVCSLKASCPVVDGKKQRYLRYETKAWRVALRRVYEDSDAFKEKYRWRSGIEATMSEYDKKTGVKRVRVRGLPAVRYCAVLKAVSINLFRATAVRNAINALQGTPGNGKSISDCVLLVFKELLGMTRESLGSFSPFPPRNNDYILEIAA
jgi:hypothetical protein